VITRRDEPEGKCLGTFLNLTLLVALGLKWLSPSCRSMRRIAHVSSEHSPSAQNSYVSIVTDHQYGEEVLYN
jgi:hypothetical protein